MAEVNPDGCEGVAVPTIVIRIPTRREVSLAGRKQVAEALRELGIAPDTVLVIRGDRLLTRDAWLEEDDRVEVRPVMSGGGESCAA
jgi:sulfur carrier protein